MKYTATGKMKERAVKYIPWGLKIKKVLILLWKKVRLKTGRKEIGKKERKKQKQAGGRKELSKIKKSKIMDRQEANLGK